MYPDIYLQYVAGSIDNFSCLGYGYLHNHKLRRLLIDYLGIALVNQEYIEIARSLKKQHSNIPVICKTPKDLKCMPMY